MSCRSWSFGSYPWWKQTCCSTDRQFTIEPPIRPAPPGASDPGPDADESPARPGRQRPIRPRPRHRPQLPAAPPEHPARPRPSSPLRRYPAAPRRPTPARPPVAITARNGRRCLMMDRCIHPGVCNGPSSLAARPRPTNRRRRCQITARSAWRRSPPECQQEAPGPPRGHNHAEPPGFRLPRRAQTGRTRG